MIGSKANNRAPDYRLNPVHYILENVIIHYKDFVKVSYKGISFNLKNNSFNEWVNKYSLDISITTRNLFASPTCTIILLQKQFTY